MNHLLISVLLSLLPIVELRGGIPYAIANGINPFIALTFCCLANILIIIPLFLFLDFLHKSFLKIKSYEKFFNFYIKSIRKRKEKVEKMYQTYGTIALAIFVAIPLPVTGVWTATFIAWLIGLKRMKSFLAIALGVIIAGILVTLIASGVITVLNFW